MYGFIIVVTMIFNLFPFYLVGGEKIRPLYLSLTQFLSLYLSETWKKSSWSSLCLKLSPFFSSFVIGFIWVLSWRARFFLITCWRDRGLYYC
ncbi:DUF6044 family protein [Aeribacillus sp. FSL K6-8394]|uniref:DUF6044 family protein n=1 Tax=Aeribacillus sp. FSL K6-8394 TaxID=2954570 RepID=UPI004046F087